MTEFRAELRHEIIAKLAHNISTLHEKAISKPRHKLKQIGDFLY